MEVVAKCLESVATVGNQQCSVYLNEKVRSRKEEANGQITGSTNRRKISKNHSESGGRKNNKRFMIESDMKKKKKKN